MMLLWGILPSSLALVLMMSSSGLAILQSVSLIFALPLMFVLILALVSILKMLRAEVAGAPLPQVKTEREEDGNLESATLTAG